MIQKEIIDTLSSEFKARLCPLDAIKSFNNARRGYDLTALDTILFPVSRPEVLRSLLDFGYTDLLHTLLSKIEIHQNAFDTFLSEIDTQFLELIEKVLKEQSGQITISADQRGLLAKAPNFLLDFSLPAISQIHSEVELHSNQFHDLLRTVGGRTEMLFLNAKGASRASNAIMCWVASNMGIPMDYGLRINQTIGVF